MATFVQLHQGDLLTVTQGILVHGCNAQGRMGSGVAKQVRAKYPGAFSAYRNAYETVGLRVGDVIEYALPRPGRPPLLIIANAITQLRYGREKRQVDYDGMRRCFEHVARLAKRSALYDIHFPLIGCDRGGGTWSVVVPIIEKALEGLRAHLWVRESEHADVDES